jgi:hypothetical protein
MTLRYLLQHSHDFPWNSALYLPRGSEWSYDTPATVLDPNDCEDEEEDPPFARVNQLKYALDIATVQSVVANARMQLPNPTDHDLLCAFDHYHRHDAFIDFLR